MTTYDFLKTEKKLKKALDEERYQHTLGVMFTSASMAMVHDYDVQTAQMAGLLHDCAKCIPNKKKLELCDKNKIELTDFERTHPYLIHAKLGAYLAREKYGIMDSEILSAIRYHTTGRPDMAKLEKIVYIADYIEPMRNRAKNLALIRKLAFQDLDFCMYQILKDILEYLDESEKEIDETTRDAFLFYQESTGNRVSMIKEGGIVYEQRRTDDQTCLQGTGQ